ncbi:MAG: DUF393 domain-containing protein [Wenzhouxiangellaceae bacterium]|nr:DUF393 domain-containing protein [Wenzhouxiangellaceae bacterium]
MTVTVWYDGGCPLCRREIAFMRRLDRRERIRFVDVSEGSEAGPACPLDRETLLARFHAREEGAGASGDATADAEGGARDEIVSGAAAFAAMWRAIPLLRPLGLLARNRYVLNVLEFGYRGFLRFRPGLQKFFGWIDRTPSSRRA